MNKEKGTIIANSDNCGMGKAVKLLKAGEVVALPTETVYGLAGNALEPHAIAKIFAAKNRPQDNPLIVHVSSLEMVRGSGLEVTDLAVKLAERFWPGPLTMILKRTAKCAIPQQVSCGLDSVAVRIPNNPFMSEVIKLCDFPLAAPSANLSGSPSPTTAQHVLDDLQGRIPLIIDGGECQIGIESTVVSFDGGKIRILRPGAVTPEMLSEFTEVTVDDNGSLLSPGTRYKHYSPKAKVIAVEAVPDGCKYAIAEPDTRTLYAKFREFDEMGADVIYVKLPEKSGIGLALYNRLIRAAEVKSLKQNRQ